MTKHGSCSMCSAHYGALHNPLYIDKAAAGNSQACVLHMGHDPNIHKRRPHKLSTINLIEINRLTEDKETTESLKMTEEEYNQIISKFGTGHRTELKCTGYDETSRKAREAASPDEELTESNFNRVNTEGFEKAVVLLKYWAEMTMREMFSKRKFRIMIDYDADKKKTDFAIYTPVGDGKGDIQQESPGN